MLYAHDDVVVVSWRSVRYSFHPRPWSSYTRGLQLIGPFNINYYYRHRLCRVIVVVVVVVGKPAPKEVRPRVTRGASPFSESTTGLQAARLNPDEGTVAVAAGSQRGERRYTTYTVGAPVPAVAWHTEV